MKRGCESPRPHQHKPPTDYTNFTQWLRRTHNLKDITIHVKIKKLKAIQKQVNLWNQEAVRNYIQNCPHKNGYKNQLGYAYRDWCEYQGFSFHYHRYPIERELPYIPLEKEIDQLIGALKNSKYAALLQLLKETAVRPIEAMNLRVKDFDLERNIVTLNHPAKGSNPRQIKLSNKLISMLSVLFQEKKIKDKVWNTQHKSIRVTFARVRRNTAIKLGNPNLNRITLRIECFGYWNHLHLYLFS